MIIVVHLTNDRVCVVSCFMECRCYGCCDLICFFSNFSGLFVYYFLCFVASECIY